MRGKAGRIYIVYREGGNMKLVAKVVTLAILMFIAGSAYALASIGTPTRSIQDLDAKLDDYKTGPNLTEADKEHNRELKRDILHGTFDVKELARLALEKHWFPRTYKQRQEFVDLMTNLLEDRAILSKEQGQKKAKSERVYAVKYLGDKFLNQKQSRAVTNTSVYVKSEDIVVKLDYKLRNQDSEWKIYDVIMDGASLVDNYKYQFDRIITKNDYAELVRRMDAKLQEIREEGDEESGG